jgi:hypothetical protein
VGVYYLTFATFFPLQVTLPDFFLADQLTSQVSKMAYALNQSTNFLFLSPIKKFALLIIILFRCKPLEVLSSTFATMVGETTNIDTTLAKKAPYSKLSVSLLL